MPHKSGKEAYPATPGHPGKGKHTMPGGKVMPNTAMKPKKPKKKIR